MITRRCKSCLQSLPLSSFDLSKRTRRCKACAEPWPAAKIAIARLYFALGKSLPRLAEALGYTESTAKSYLYGRANLSPRASLRVRDAYQAQRQANNGVLLVDSVEELEELAMNPAIIHIPGCMAPPPEDVRRFIVVTYKRKTTRRAAGYEPWLVEKRGIGTAGEFRCCIGGFIDRWLTLEEALQAVAEHPGVLVYWPKGTAKKIAALRAGNGAARGRAGRGAGP